jgi:Dullard-like phosphatase family protein
MSPDLAKKTFLLNQKRLKTILGKNSLDQKPKAVVQFPEGYSHHQPTLTRPPSKVASARTSPQITKLKSPALLKGVSRDKSRLGLGTEASLGQGAFKPFQKCLLSELKQSRAKLFTKLTAKCNKENAKNEDNAPPRPPAPDLEATIPQDWSKVRQISQKNCIFSNFLGTSHQASKEAPKLDETAQIFRRSFLEKFCCPTFEVHCQSIAGIRSMAEGVGTPLEGLIDSFVKTLKHPSFLQLSGDLKMDNEMAKAIDLFVKLEAFFVLFLVPISQSTRIKSTVSLKASIDAICWNLGAMGRIFREFCKNSGKNFLSESIQSVLKTAGLTGVDRSPTKTHSQFTENNAFLKTSIKVFVGELKPLSLRKSLSNLLKKVVESDIFQFISISLDTFLPFFERFQAITANGDPETPSADHPNASISSTSYYYEDEDPYFILQPLKIEKYLPDKPPLEKPYTLVLDLDETLVHFTENDNKGKFLVRPFAREFLLKLQDYFEIVVFTAALKDYADWILDRIDTCNSIRFRLYRDHTTFQNGVYLKDLSRLNRDLTKTIIVDNNPDNFQMHPENGIYIKSWYQDPNDLALKHLTNVLIRIAESNESDIRRALANHNRRLTGQREVPDRPTE